MSELRDRVQNQRVHVSMNCKHICVQSGEQRVVQLKDGSFDRISVPQITFHREGEQYESPWTRYYDLSVPEDKQAIDALKKMLEEHPHLHDHPEFRIRIVGEFESSEPWPGYDDQDAEQVIAYYHAMPQSVKPQLEKVLSYELSKDEPNKSKITAIESLENSMESAAKKAASAGVKL